MIYFAIGFAVGGLFSCLAIALFPDRVMSAYKFVAGLWHEAKWYEKVGLVLLVAPIPGPVDEIVGALVIRRIGKRVSRGM